MDLASNTDQERSMEMQTPYLDEYTLELKT